MRLADDRLSVPLRCCLAGCTVGPKYEMPSVPTANRASSLAFAKHWTAVLAPIPRRSQLTMSKRA